MQKVSQPTFLECSMESELASPGATKPVGKSFLKNSSNFFHATPEAKKCSLSCFSCGSEGALGCRRKCCSSTLAKNSCEDARCRQADQKDCHDQPPQAGGEEARRWCRKVPPLQVQGANLDREPSVANDHVDRDGLAQLQASNVGDGGKLSSECGRCLPHRESGGYQPAR